MTAQLEHIIHQLEKLSPEEQTMMAAQIQELLEDAEDAASVEEILQNDDGVRIPWEVVKEELKKDGLI